MAKIAMSYYSAHPCPLEGRASVSHLTGSYKDASRGAGRARRLFGKLRNISYVIFVITKYKGTDQPKSIRPHPFSDG